MTRAPQIAPPTAGRTSAAPTRRDALRAAGGAVAGLALAPAVAAAAPAGDAELLIGLLALERRLAAVYAAADRAGLLPGVAAHLRDQEIAHARGLERALAGMGRRAPATTQRVHIPGSERALARLALRLEGEAVTAYLDAIAGARSEGLLRGLGSIAASEGQHEVILRRELGLDPLG